MEGIVGDGPRGDIAVDDFSFYDGPCTTNNTITTAECSQSNPVTTTTTTTMKPTSTSTKPPSSNKSTPTTTSRTASETSPSNTKTQPSTPAQANCDFETSLCGYSRSHISEFFFLWKRVSSKKTTDPEKAQNGKMKRIKQHSVFRTS